MSAAAARPGAPFDERALLDLLYAEDAIYDEDASMAGRDLPPRAWRASDRAVQEMIEHARGQLDLAWRALREQARRDRVAAAIRGSFEARAMEAALRLQAVVAQSGASSSIASSASSSVSSMASLPSSPSSLPSSSASFALSSLASSSPSEAP